MHPGAGKYPGLGPPIFEKNPQQQPELEEQDENENESGSPRPDFSPRRSPLGRAIRQPDERNHKLSVADHSGKKPARKWGLKPKEKAARREIPRAAPNLTTMKGGRATSHAPPF